MLNGENINLSKQSILKLISTISDPEIPAVNVVEMGMVRDIVFENNKLNVIITPTYSGCPAMSQISNDILKLLNDNGLDAEIITRLSPPWTTDWMTKETFEKLKKSGIAPPVTRSFELNYENMFNIIKVPSNIECPFCSSEDTKLLSEFGSTACKSLHYCNSCFQAFDHFKCH